MQLSASRNLSSMPFKRDYFGKFLQRAAAVQLLRIVCDALDAKHAFAFGIDLQSQLATVQLEDQIMHRSLDRDFPLGRWLISLAVSRTALVSKDRPDCPQIQRRTAAVNEGLKNLLHVPADFEDQVAAVLDLVVRVLVTKPAALLLFQIQREAQTGRINPTLADPAQPPCSPLLGQGLCDVRQASGVRDMSEAVSFLDEAERRLACLAGHVLMAVQDHLGGKGRMPADFDGDMAPLWVDDNGPVQYRDRSPRLAAAFA
jgi:hypothetical protein